MRRTPVVHAVGPGVRTGLDRLEPIEAVFIRDRAAKSAEVRVERRQIGFLLVAIAPAGIGLPELHKRTADTEPTFVQNATVDEDALADWPLTRLGVIHDEVVIEFVDDAVTEDRPRDLAFRTLQRKQCP